MPGGRDNFAKLLYSFAAGRQAKAKHNGMFVWADSNNAGATDIDFPSATQGAPDWIPGPDQFVVRALGSSASPEAVVFVTAINAAGDKSAGVKLFRSASAWSAGSDRDAKENVEPVRARQILDRLNQIPISTWNYKVQDPSIRHIGPMAQDFYAAFGVGEDDKYIGTLDADGVALAAIQGLYGIVKEKDAKITQLETRLAALEKLVQQADVALEGGAR